MSHGKQLAAETQRLHYKVFGEDPAWIAYAPGRIEILGNHTDYNEGFVLSSAIDAGICAALSPLTDPEIRLYAADLDRSWTFPLAYERGNTPVDASAYVGGVARLLAEGLDHPGGGCMTLRASIPQGAGLSSSAALELSAGLVLAKRFGIEPDPMDLARIAQRAEIEFAGVRCGLLDQITSLFGAEGAMVLTDFRSLDVRRIAVPGDAVFLVCDTGVRHRLSDSAYNERRARCEEAVAGLQRLTGEPIRALRDVDAATLERHAPGLDPVTVRRARHIVGENERVQQGCDALAAGDLRAFGRLMFESHESSVANFENSCPELDVVVRTARETPGVLGARLSGGGFGGSAVALVESEAAETAGIALARAYRAEMKDELGIRRVLPSAGARLLIAVGKGCAGTDTFPSNGLPAFRRG